MRLPLYSVLQKKEESPKKSLDSNMGLWFERFFDRYDYDKKDGKFKVPDGEKTDWLQKIKNAGNTEALRTAAKQQLALVNALEGKYKFFNTQWHFVTGTGYPHPVENGLLWHKTYGVPYLSGAAVKGLVRAWVEEWQEFESEEKRKECLFSWFGSDDKDPKEQQKTSQAGDIIFFDAFPVQAVKLATDIMTPHYGKWYSEGNTITDVANQPEKIPADWHDPVPIPFLVVDKQTSFLFSIAPRHNKVEVNLDEVMGCLMQALDWLGAGAKTATGYGQMISEESIAQQKSEKAQDWLDNAIQSLRNDKDLKGQPEENLWKKALSEKWLFAPTELKQTILELIKIKWKELKISWEKPAGKSAEEAKRNFTK